MAKSEKKALTALIRTVPVVMTVLCALAIAGCPNMAGGDTLDEVGGLGEVDKIGGGNNSGGGSRSISKYDVTFGADGANGTLTAEVDGTSIESPARIKVEEGKIIVFTASPNENYIVDKWTITDGTFESGTGVEGSLNAKVKVTAAVKVTVTFKTVPAGSVKYTVEHWHQNIEDDEYTKEESENKTGTAGEQTRAEAKPYAGFTAKPSITQETIAADGSTAVKVYYDRKIITLTLDFNGGRLILPEPNKLKGRFGAAVSVNTPIKDGYTFKGWDPKLPDTFPAEDGTYTARWVEKYCKVPYAELEAHLNKASDTEINYIEITDIEASEFGGAYNQIKNKWIPGKLGQKIRDAASKKVALKLPARVEGLTDMSSCFNDCTNLVSVENIPEGVEDMGLCFYGCTSLTKAPVIPASVEFMISCFDGCTGLTQAPIIPAKVTLMSSCFNGCTGLTQGPDIPAGVTDMRWCFDGCTKLKRVKLNCPYKAPTALSGFNHAFQNCTSFEDGGIQVPQAQLTAYKNNAGSMGTVAGKFSGF